MSPLRLREFSIEPVDVQVIQSGSPKIAVARELAKFRAQALELNLAVLRFPTVLEDDNDRFLRMMERYFAQDEQALHVDVRQRVYRQVGYTEPYIEEDKRWFAEMKAFPEDCQPYGRNHTGSNPLARFFWRMGDRPKHSAFADLQADPVIPKAFAPEWESTMNDWGNLLLKASYMIGSITESAFDLNPGTISHRFKEAPHLLAPTGCDLMWLLSHAININRLELARRIMESEDLPALASDLNLLGHVISRFHLDFNGGATLHGRSNFPGLIGWTRSGAPFQVKVPKGCLLAQFGQQMEHLFAGGMNQDGIMAGFHEVAIILPTLTALQRALREGRSTVRVSSTFFPHFAMDGELNVLPQYRGLPGALERYPDTLVGTHSAEVIASIGLGKETLKH